MKINWKAAGVATLGTVVVAGIGYLLTHFVIRSEWAIYMIGAFWVAQYAKEVAYYRLNDRDL